MKCTYCGEKEGQKYIINPNSPDIWMDEKDSKWWVCLGCEGTIHWQKQHSIGAIVGGEIGEKLKQEAKERLDQISKETGTPYMIAEIRKKKQGEEG